MLELGVGKDLVIIVLRYFDNMQMGELISETIILRG